MEMLSPVEENGNGWFRHPPAKVVNA